jgi:hypothetical protein
MLFLISIPAFAKDVTYRLTGAEPLTFTIPADWSSGWGPLMCAGFDPEAPVDLISFSQPTLPLPEGAPKHRADNSVALLIDARHKLVPISEFKMQLREFDGETRTIIPAKELRGQTDQALIGYYNIRRNHRPGEDRLDAFWNLGSRTWSANSTFPADQTNWIAECVAIIESVRLADPDTAPPTPRRPTINGVEDPDFPKEAMEKWRKQHE